VKLIQTSIFSGFHTFIKLLINVVIGKVFAVYLGPAGISQLGNFMNLFVILNTTMSGGVNNGIVKYISEHKSNSQQVSKIIYNTLVFILLFSVLSILGYFLFINEVNKLLFANTLISYNILISLVLAAFFATIFNYFISILNGLGEIKKLTFLNVLFSILLFILSITLVSKYYLKGVVYSNLIAFFVISCLSAFIVLKSYRISFSTKLIDLTLNKQFVQYTLMTFTSIATVPLIQMIIRKHYTILYGIETAGLWQGVVRLSESYLSVFSIILITYFLPKYSELTDRKLIRNEILFGYKNLIPALLLFFIVLYFLRFIIIHLLYSNEFDSIANYLPLMFIGDFFKICSWILAFLFIAKSKTKSFIISEITFGFILLMGTFFLSERFQVKGYVFSYIICYFFYFVFCVVYFRKYLLR